MTVSPSPTPPALPPVTVTKPTLRPARKVAASTLASAIVTILVWVVNNYQLLPQGKQVPDNVQGALVVLLTFVAGYITPPGEDESVTQDEDGKTVTGRVL